MGYFQRSILNLRLLQVLVPASILFTVAMASGAPPRPAFSHDHRLNEKVPHILLTWELPERTAAVPLEFELQRAASGEFLQPVAQYTGPDRASFVAGLAEGDYFFRVRTVSGDGAFSPWSEPVHLTVDYHSLVLAFLLFGIGAFVSIATAALVVLGDRRARRDPSMS